MYSGNITAWWLATAKSLLPSQKKKKKNEINIRKDKKT